MPNGKTKIKIFDQILQIRNQWYPHNESCVWSSLSNTANRFVIWALISVISLCPGKVVVVSTLFRDTCATCQSHQHKVHDKQQRLNRRLDLIQWNWCRSGMGTFNARRSRKCHFVKRFNQSRVSSHVSCPCDRWKCAITFAATHFDIRYIFDTRRSSKIWLNRIRMAFPPNDDSYRWITMCVSPLGDWLIGLIACRFRAKTDK